MVLGQRWGLTITSIEYRPVGFGSHHWHVIDSTGTPWFVTVDELCTKRLTMADLNDHSFNRLYAALATASDLRRAGASFVIGPHRTLDGGPLVRIEPGLAIARYPFIDGHSYTFHTIPTPATAAMSSNLLGPTQHRRQPAEKVLTHGEPHPGNTMHTQSGLVLIDWDTVLIAPPERDLWSLESGDGAVTQAYTAATGTRPRSFMMEMYRIKWDLADLAAYAGRFAGAHLGNEDDQQSWANLEALLTGLET